MAGKVTSGNHPMVEQGCHFDILVFDVDDAQEWLDKYPGWRLTEPSGSGEETDSGDGAETPESYLPFTTGQGQPAGFWVHPGLAPRIVNFYFVESVAAYVSQAQGTILEQGDKHPRDDKPYAMVVAPGGLVYGVHEHDFSKD